MPPALPAEAEAALGRFRAFYDELFTVKQMLGGDDWEALVGRRSAAAPLQEQLLRAVQLRLRRVIAAQGFGAAVAPGAPVGVDPGYVMAAVADEALLHDVTWIAHDLWAETPLEDVLYRSRIAGDRVFEAAEALLARRDPDPDGLAMTILLALEVGFRGRYFGGDDHDEIERMKRRLFEAVFRTRYRPAEDTGGLVVGQTEPLRGREPVRLPPLRPWLMASAGVVLAYLVISGLVWLNQVSDILATARHIIGARPGSV